MIVAKPPSSRLAMLAVLFALAVLATLTAGVLSGGFARWWPSSNASRVRYVRPTPELEAASRAIGDTIVAAIERYRIDAGLYPVSLDQLVPKYLPAIDPPVAGWCAWQYKQDPRLGFTLGYRVGPLYEEDTYVGAGQRWRIVR